MCIRDRAFVQSGIFVRRKRCCNFVNTLVPGNSDVAANIVPFDTVGSVLNEIPQRLPEFSIQDVLAFRRSPAPSLPVRNPLAYSANDVGGVGVDRERP